VSLVALILPEIFMPGAALLSTTTGVTVMAEALLVKNKKKARGMRTKAIFLNKCIDGLCH
jgi:hypothetical protein